MGILDGLITRRKRKADPDPELEGLKRQEKTLLATYRIQALQQLAKTRPDMLAVLLFPRIGKVMTSQQQERDPMHELAMEALRSKLTRDPLDDLLKLQQGARAMRELQAELSPGVEAAPPADGAAGIISALANSPFGEAFGEAFGDVVGKAMKGAPASPAANRQLPAGGAAGQLPAAETPAEQSQPAGEPAEEEAAVGPINLLQAKLLLLRLKKMAPAEAALQLVQLAQQREDVNDLLVVILETADADLEALLVELGQVPGWDLVATWLLENTEYTRALVAELHNLAQVETAAAPTPEVQ